MKKLFVTCLFASIFIISSAQIWEKELLEKNPFANAREKYRAFSSYKKTHPNPVGYKPYARELDFILERSSKHSSFNSQLLYTEWESLKRRKKRNTNSNWIAKGPINTPLILSNGKKRGNGRVNCISFDPFDPNIIWVGSPAGGLWKTSDGGNNWTTNTDNLPVIGVSCIAIDPTNNQNMYIVTGDANASDTYSIGVLKSIDGGLNWSPTGLSYNIDEEKRINKLIINPRYTDSLFVVTNSNIMISPDGGTTWNIVGIAGRWRDAEFNPSNPNIIYAAKQSNGGSNIYRSVNGGGSWSVINNGIASSGKDRPLIAITPINPNVVYALFSATDDSFHGLYKSIDSGDTWVLQSNSPNILGRATDGTATGGQSWYDLSFGVSTNNENHLYVGGINLWKSMDGGQSWVVDGSSGNGNYSYMHVDQHALEYNPLNHIAYAGNDGGVYKWMDNINKWVDISDGLEISQFYKLGVSQSNPNKIIAGAQDNGTEMLTNSTWDAILGGDGMECAIDPYDEDIIYAEYQYGGMRKSYNGGVNWENIKPPQIGYEGGWVTPYEIHPNNPLLIVAGFDEVYRSFSGGDVSSFNSWDSISYNVSGGQSIKTIALAPSDQSYIYAGTYSRLKVTKDGGVNWENIKPGLPNYNMTDIAVSSSNPNHVWVTFSEYVNNHKVYKSIDGGQNWVNITSNGLPNLPVNCIVYQAFTNDDIYVGTDIGVYYKNNSMTDWVPYMSGLPNVIVKDLEINYQSGKISAATYGRGVWQSPVNSLNTHIEENIMNDYFSFSNPTKNFINIKTNYLKNYSVSLYDLTGKLIFCENLSGSQQIIDVSKISKGYYIISFEAKDLSINNRKKIIIE